MFVFLFMERKQGACFASCHVTMVTGKTCSLSNLLSKIHQSATIKEVTAIILKAILTDAYDFIEQMSLSLSPHHPTIDCHWCT